MYDIQPLIERVRSYAKRAGIEEKTASYRVFVDVDRLGSLLDDKTCTVRTAKTAWATRDSLEAKLEHAA